MRSLDDVIGARRKAGAKIDTARETRLIYGGSMANDIARMV